MTTQTYLEAFGARIGVLPASSDEDTPALFDLASIARPASRDTAAALACWLAGISGRPLAIGGSLALERSR